MDTIEIGQAIQNARKTMDPPRTQGEVAAALDMSPATISQIETGQATEIGLRRLMRVMEYVGLEITVHPARMGYTLDDAKEDNRKEVMQPRRRTP